MVFILYNFLLPNLIQNTIFRFDLISFQINCLRDKLEARCNLRLFAGPPSAVAAMSTNNNQTTTSNFKRQNTVDSATIKANNESRMSATTPSRPSTGGLTSNSSSKASSSASDSKTPTSPKARGITKSNTMSNATGRGVAVAAAANRRSAIDPQLKCSSTDKTNALDGDSLNSR